jgi:hypothetical protein
MKKFFTILGALALTIPSFAQEAVRPATEDEVFFANQGPRRTTERSNRGSEFFCEDFSNGLAGSTAFGAWTPGGLNASVWGMATADSPAGFYSSNLAAMASPSAANGWVIFDCDLAQGGAITANNPVENMTGWLTSPELNMSDLENVKVEFNQYFRYCCAQLSPLTVEVSVDGQLSWTTFSATGTLITGANAISANPLLTTIDISCVAANQPSVYVRWAYNSAVAAAYSHYFWGLDDICIYETTNENDLEITQVTNGDIFNLFEYTVTPLEQAITSANGGLLAGVIYRNSGRQDQTNCQITVEILDESETNVLATANFPAFDMVAPANEVVCPAPILDTIFIQTGWVPTEAGNYVVRATIASDQVEDSPDNNVGIRRIEYTADEYGHHGTGLATGELRGQTDPDNPDQFIPFGVANYFHFPNEGSTVYGMTVEFGPNTDPGVNFLVAFYNDQSTTQGQNFSNEAFGYYSMADVWVDNGPIYLPFETPFTPVAGTEDFYTAAVQVEDNSLLELTVAAQPNSDSDNSTLRWSFNSNQQLTWFGRNTFTPAIRAILSERSINVDEIENSAALDVFPNPAVNEIRVNVDLQNASNVAYEIRDINGKLVTFNNMGNYPAGNTNFNVNISEMAAGTYVIGIVADGAMIAREKLVVSK